MSSFVLPMLLVGWVLLSAWAAHRLGEWSAQRGEPRGPMQALRLELKALTLIALLPLPLIDELLTQPQFDALCREHAGVQVISGLLPGQRVHHRVLPPEPWPGLTLPVSHRKHLYITDDTHQTVATFSSFEAHGGKLARLTGVSTRPLTFEGRCAPVHPRALLAQAGLQPVEAGVQEGGTAASP